MPLFELVARDRISDRYCEENNRSKNHKQIVHFQHLSNSAIHRRFIVPFTGCGLAAPTEGAASALLKFWVGQNQNLTKIRT